MANLILLIAEIWILGIIILTLHAFSSRIGFAPLLMFVGGLAVMTQSQLGIFIEPYPNFILFITSNVFVPIILFITLVTYIVNGSLQARMLIYGVLGISLLTLAIQLLYQLQLSLPQSGTISGLSSDILFPPINPRITLASIMTFAMDMVIIAIFYQGLRNYIPRLHETVAIGLALLVALWNDAILFRILSDLGTPDFAWILPGDTLGKTFSAILLWPLAAGYLTIWAPRYPFYRGSSKRRTLDLLFGSFNEIKIALDRTQAALRQSEALRREEESYFRQIAENINEALWLASADQQHPFFVNPAYERIWGQNAQAIYANVTSFLNAIHPNDRERVLNLLPKQAEGTYDIEYRVIRPDGSMRWVRDRAFPIYDNTGKVYRIAGIMEDITDRKQSEKQQLDLMIEREKLKFLKDFIGEVTHDLKNPLSSINLRVHYLSKTDDPDKRQLYLQELTELTNRMNHMIEDLLILARLESVHETTLMRVDIGQLLNEIYNRLRPLYDEKGVDLVYHSVDNPLIVLGDGEDLGRSFENLLDNALHYTPVGGKVDINVLHDANQVIIQVRDTGIGIPPEDLPNLFKRFFRARNAREVDPAGTGIGLAIVKRVIEQHQGKVEVNSQLGEGTIFTVQLPLET